MAAGDPGETPKPGSYIDLSRRMDNMEENHRVLSKEVGQLTGTVGRVELNQKHAEELTKLRFDSLDTSITSQSGKLDAFIQRIEGIITGEVQTAQGKQGVELVADYQKWRATVEERFDRTELSPVGRTVAQVAEDREELRRRLDRLDVRLAQGVGALAVLIFLIPYIRQIASATLGIPLP